MGFSHICQVLPRVREEIRTQTPVWASRHINRCTVLPELGFLLAVTLNPNTREGVYNGQGMIGDYWELELIDGDLVHCKTAIMRDLDAQYGELPSEIASE